MGSGICRTAFWYSFHLHWSQCKWFWRKSHAQGPDTYCPASPIFMTQTLVKTKTFPASEPSVVHPSNPTSYGQIRDVETATDLHCNDSSKQTFDSRTDIETAYEPMQHPPLRQSDPPSAIEYNDPTTELFRKTNLVTLKAVKTNCALIIILTTHRHTDIDVCKSLFHPFLCVIFIRCFFFRFSIFSAHTSFSFHTFGAYAYKIT